MNLSELLDSQDKEIEILTDNINALQEKLSPMVMSVPSDAETVKDTTSHGYVIGDHIAKNNERISELHRRLRTLHEGVAL